MELINYNRYKKWGPRTTIVLVIVQTPAIGLFLGAALLLATHTSNGSACVWLFALAFGSGVSTLEAALVVLHNYSLSPDAGTTKIIPDSVKVR